MDTSRIDRLEERMSHLIRAADDLSQVVARQDREIASLKRQVEMLVVREVEREAAEGAAVFDDRPPPHY